MDNMLSPEMPYEPSSIRRTRNKFSRQIPRKKISVNNDFHSSAISSTQQRRTHREEIDDEQNALYIQQISTGSINETQHDGNLEEYLLIVTLLNSEHCNGGLNDRTYYRIRSLHHVLSQYDNGDRIMSIRDVNNSLQNTDNSVNACFRK